jgi:protein subunit release factor B
MVKKEKVEALRAKMERLGVREEDLIERFVLGSGKGGQKINKTSSCVYLKHLPSGIEVKCQQERSRELNRYIARSKLCEELQMRIDRAASAREQEREKIRRQKRKRSKRAQLKVLASKRLRGETKSLRRSPEENS